MKDKIIEELKKVYDPEMPSVDVFNLGLIYDIDIKEEKVKLLKTNKSLLFKITKSNIKLNQEETVVDIGIIMELINKHWIK